MGWWEELTGSGPRYRARRDADIAAANAANAQTEEIGKAREILNRYYLGGTDMDTGVRTSGALEEIAGSGKRAEDITKGITDSTIKMLQKEYAGARGDLEGGIERGREASDSYYRPFEQSAGTARRGLEVLTGAAEGTPEEVARLTTDSPLARVREQKMQEALGRAMRARGGGTSRYAAGKSAELGGQLAAEEQDRRIAQLMGLYQQGTQGMGVAGGYGQGIGQLLSSGAGKMADLRVGGAGAAGGVGMQGYGNLARIEQDTGNKRAGTMIDLAESLAASHGAEGAARAGAFNAASANSMANFNASGNPLMDLAKVAIGAGQTYGQGKDAGWW